MLTDDELDSMRATSAQAMPDECTITRLDWPGAALNTSTGLYTPPTGTEIYAGVCRLRPEAANREALTHGDGQVTTSRYILTVPVDVGPLAIGDICRITDSSDPHIADRSWRVIEVLGGSWQVDQGASVEEVIGRDQS